jgi:hypothetical protein
MAIHASASIQKAGFRRGLKSNSFLFMLWEVFDWYDELFYFTELKTW